MVFRNETSHGVDSQSGLAHSAVVTAANVHDKHPLPDLLHGNEQRVYGDSAYASQKDLIAGKAPNAKDFTNQRTRYAGIVDEAVRSKNRNKSKIRSRVEHVWRGQAPLGIWQGTLPRSAEERHTGIHHLGAGQHLPRSTKADSTGASMRRETRAKSPQNSPDGPKNWHQFDPDFAKLRCPARVPKF